MAGPEIEINLCNTLTDRSSFAKITTRYPEFGELSRPADLRDGATP